MTDEEKRTSRLAAVKGYLQAAFPGDTLQVKSQDGALRWDLQVIRGSQVVHEARVMRKFLEDDGDNPDPVAALTLWSLAARMKQNGTTPVWVDTSGLT